MELPKFLRRLGVSEVNIDLPFYLGNLKYIFSGLDFQEFSSTETTFAIFVFIHEFSFPHPLA